MVTCVARHHVLSSVLNVTSSWRECLLLFFHSIAELVPDACISMQVLLVFILFLLHTSKDLGIQISFFHLLWRGWDRIRISAIRKLAFVWIGASRQIISGSLTGEILLCEFIPKAKDARNTL